MTDDNNNAVHHEAHEELPPGAFGDGGDFDDFEGGGASHGTLGDLWRNNPGVKIAVVVGVLVLLIGGIVLFGGRPPQTLNSKVAGTSTIKEAPGGDVSKSYADAVAEKNQQALEDAEKAHGSNIPEPISPPKEPTPLPQDQATTEDPLARWRRIQEERTKHDTVKKPDVQQQDPNAPAIKALADAMAKQMESILKSMKPVAPQYKSIMTDEAWKSQQDKDQKDAQTAAAQTAQTATNQTQNVNILEPAGSIEYGQLITQANTDAPGPVLVELASGPLSGSRMLGSFKQLGQADYLVLSFDTVVIKGVSYSASAVALDPSTANPGLVSEVDNRYFERVVLPAAAAFVEGMGSAVADSGNTNVSVNGSEVLSSTTKLDTKQQVFAGLEAGSSKFGQIIDQQADQVKPLITVDAGTPVAILFTSPVTDSNSNSATK